MRFRFVTVVMLFSSFLSAQSVRVPSGKAEGVLAYNGTAGVPRTKEYNEPITQRSYVPTNVVEDQSVLTTFVVSDASDLGDSNINDATYSPPTLRSAIQNANKLGGAHAIVFAASAALIRPVTPLPSLIVPVTIDGSAVQGGVMLDGSLTMNAYGLTLGKTSSVKNMIFRRFFVGLGLAFGSDRSIIQRCRFDSNAIGLNVNSRANTIGGPNPGDRNYACWNSSAGISLSSSDSNLIQNNFVGTPDGVTAGPNAFDGIYVYGKVNRILDNLASGNQRSAISTGELGSGNVIRGNIVGLDSTGRRPLPNGGEGIKIFGDRDTVANNFIAASVYGILVQGQSDGCVIRGNIVGPNKGLDSLIGNPGAGLYILGSHVTIENNIVSGNNPYGIRLTGWGGAVLRGNLIGTDPTGTLDWGNTDSGIYLDCDNTMIGGSTPSERNVIAGNGGAGIEMFGGTTFTFSGSFPNLVQGNVVRNNVIGTEITSSSRLPNFTGIKMWGYIDSNSVRDNLITGNQNHGIWMRRYGNGIPSRNVFTNNHIGVDMSGLLALPNDSAGVMIEEAQTNLVGGDNAADGNTIMYNGSAGVSIRLGTGNAVLSNTITKNKKLAIDLGAEGPTLNDSDDADNGPNNLQNYPVITFNKVTGGNTTLYGFLKSVPLKSYKVQLYSNEKPDSTGFGEGDNYHQTLAVNTDSSGYGQFTSVITGVHQRIVATATDPNGNTSEYSKSPIIVNSNADAPDINAVDGYADTGGPPVNGAPEVTLRAAIQTAQHLQGEDYIAFDIPGNLSTNFISPASALPVLDLSGVTIDGTTQSGYAVGNNTIALNGSQAGNVDGLQITGSRSVIKALDITNFQQNGVDVSGSDARIEDTRISSNMINGVYASKDLHLSGKVFVTNTGGGNGGSCQPGAINAGIFVVHDLIADSIESTNNCGSGIRTYQGSVTVKGTLNVSNNSEDGVKADGNIEIVGPSIVAQSNKFNGLHAFGNHILLKSTASSSVGFPIRMNSNGGSGVYAQLGAVEIEGKSQMNDNGPAKVEYNHDADGGIYAYTFLRVGQVEAKNNRGYGLFCSDGSIEVLGNAMIDNNAKLGINAGGSLLVMDGKENSVSNNGEHGIAVDNGEVRIFGKIILVHNNFANGKESPLDCLPRDTDHFTPYGKGGGITANSAILNDVEVLDNCGAGIGTGILLRIQGRANIRNNSGNGIQTRNARIAGGTICDNAGYGIRLFGPLYNTTAGTLILGSVQVCENGLGGIKGVKDKRPTLGKTTINHTVSSVSQPSKISGSSITNNVGNGVEFDSFSPLVISKSNISGNTQLAVKNLDTSAAIVAQGVWWGNSAGAGNSVSAGVNASNFRTAPVSLTISHSLDSTFNTPGKNDSVSVLVRNWQKPNDSIQVTITESHGWLQSPASVIVTPRDTIPGLTAIVVAIPQNAAPGDSTIIHITAQSLVDTTAKDVDSFVILAYQPRLMRVVLLPDSIRLLPGDSTKFFFSGYDQAEKVFQVVTKWIATGGSIDSNGAYRAGTTLGFFAVTAQDTVSGLIANAKVVIVSSLTSVDKKVSLPTTFSLDQNYPNPFNPSTIIGYDVSQTSHIELAIYDVLGRMITKLVDEEQAPGRYRVVWKPNGLSSGLYFYRLRASQFSSVKKLLLIR